MSALQQRETIGVADFLSHLPCGTELSNEVVKTAFQSNLLPTKVTYTREQAPIPLSELFQLTRTLKSPHLLHIANDWMHANGFSSLFARPLNTPLPFSSVPSSNHARMLFQRQYSPNAQLKLNSFASNYSRVAQITGHSWEVLCLAYDRLQNRFLTGSNDWSIKIWCAHTGWLINTLRGHTGEVEFITINKENTMIASGATDGTIRVWNLFNGHPITILRTPTVPHPHQSDILINQVTAVLWSHSAFSENRFLTAATKEDGMLRLWKWERKNDPCEPGYFPNPEQPIIIPIKTKDSDYPLCMSLDNAGLRLAVGGKDGIIRVFSLLPFIQHQVSLLETDTIMLEPSLLSSVSSSALSSDSLLCTAHLPMNGSLVDIQFSNLGTRLLASSDDGLATIWSYKDKKWSSLTLSMENEVASLVPNPVTISNDGLSSSNGNLIHSKKKKSTTRALEFCWLNDDAHVVTSGSDGFLRVYDSYSGRLLRLFRGDGKAPNEETFTEILTLEPHPVLNTVFLSSTYEKGYVAIWDCTTSVPLWSQSFEGAVGNCKFAQDGWSFLVSEFFRPIFETDDGNQITHVFSLAKEEWTCPTEQFFANDLIPLESSDGIPTLLGHRLPYHLETPQYVRPRDRDEYISQPSLDSRLRIPVGLDSTYLEHLDQSARENTSFLLHEIQDHFHPPQLMSQDEIKKHIRTKVNRYSKSSNTSATDTEYIEMDWTEVLQQPMDIIDDSDDEDFNEVLANMEENDDDDEEEDDDIDEMDLEPEDLDSLDLNTYSPSRLRSRQRNSSSTYRAQTQETPSSSRNLRSRNVRSRRSGRRIERRNQTRETLGTLSTDHRRRRRRRTSRNSRSSLRGGWLIASSPIPSAYRYEDDHESTEMQSPDPDDLSTNPTSPSLRPTRQRRRAALQALHSLPLYNYPETSTHTRSSRTRAGRSRSTRRILTRRSTRFTLSSSDSSVSLNNTASSPSPTTSSLPSPSSLPPSVSSSPTPSRPMRRRGVSVTQTSDMSDHEASDLQPSLFSSSHTTSLQGHASASVQDMSGVDEEDELIAGRPSLNSSSVENSNSNEDENEKLSSEKETSEEDYSASVLQNETEVSGKESPESNDDLEDFENIITLPIGVEGRNKRKARKKRKIASSIQNPLPSSSSGRSAKSKAIAKIKTSVALLSSFQASSSSSINLRGDMSFPDPSQLTETSSTTIRLRTSPRRGRSGPSLSLLSNNHEHIQEFPSHSSLMYSSSTSLSSLPSSSTSPSLSNSNSSPVPSISALPPSSFSHSIFHPSDSSFLSFHDSQPSSSYRNKSSQHSYFDSPSNSYSSFSTEPISLSSLNGHYLRTRQKRSLDDKKDPFQERPGRLAKRQCVERLKEAYSYDI